MDILQVVLGAILLAGYYLIENCLPRRLLHRAVLDRVDTCCRLDRGRLDPEAAVNKPEFYEVLSTVLCTVTVTPWWWVFWTSESCADVSMSSNSFLS